MVISSQTDELMPSRLKSYKIRTKGSQSLSKRSRDRLLIIVRLFGKNKLKIERSNNRTKTVSKRNSQAKTRSNGKRAGSNSRKLAPAQFFAKFCAISFRS